jgi:hypothetical protein
MLRNPPISINNIKLKKKKITIRKNGESKNDQAGLL